MVSTPNKPEGLFQTIEKESENTCIYRRLSLRYEVELGKIFTHEEIEKAKSSPSFEREYNLKYLGKIGKVFSPQLIDQVVKFGEQYKDLPTNQFSGYSLGIDFGFGESRTALVLCELNKDIKKIRVLMAKEIEKSNPSIIASQVYDTIYLKYSNLKIFVDGSNRAGTNELRLKFGESIDYESEKDINVESDTVIPVNFATSHKEMLAHLYNIVNKQYLAVPEKFNKLIISLRTAYAKEYSLDKTETSYPDSIDALRLSLKMYQISNAYGLGY
jgi:hypothetical protein